MAEAAAAQAAVAADAEVAAAANPLDENIRADGKSNFHFLLFFNPAFQSGVTYFLFEFKVIRYLHCTSKKSPRPGLLRGIFRSRSPESAGTEARHCVLPAVVLDVRGVPLPGRGGQRQAARGPARLHHEPRRRRESPQARRRNYGPDLDLLVPLLQDPAVAQRPGHAAV